MKHKWYIKNGLKVLSLCDGISCGAVALDRAGVAVSRYSAFETDYNAIKVSDKNYPQMDRHVAEEDCDFSDFKGYDLIIGRNPITTDSSDKNYVCGKKEYGLFYQYAEALEKTGCRYFFYENNVNVDDNFKNEVTKVLGVKPILVNSKMLSAQNKERLYWTNIPYDELPKEKGIVIKNILDSNVDDKYFITDEDITYTEKIDKIKRFKVHQIAHLKDKEYKIYSSLGKGEEIKANNGEYSLYLLGDGKLRQLTALEAERMQTLPDGYTDCGIYDFVRRKLISENPTVDVLAFFFKGLQKVRPSMPNKDLDIDCGFSIDSLKGIDVLSVFDGMSCGMLAMLEAGLNVNNYYAYEIDEYAVKTSLYNFPSICQKGDVFKADFKHYEGIDYLVGGSPCTFWSIAQSPDKRETTASGIGWELFSQYVRALDEAKPKFFIYENNKSMAREIYESISKVFGFEPIMINSALVSAQNRQRYYWVGKRNEDGTYSKVDVQQPKDRGILLKDILDNNEWNAGLAMYNIEHGYNAGGFAGNKAPTLTQSSWQENHMLVEPINATSEGKAGCLRATAYKDGTRNIAGNETDRKTGVAERVCAAFDLSSNDKSYTLTARYDGAVAWNTLERHQKNMVAEPVCVASRGRNPDNPSDRTSGIPTEQRYEFHTDGKTNTLTTVQKDNYVCEPIESDSIIFAVNHQGDMQPRTIQRIGGLYGQSTRWGIYSSDGIAPTLVASAGLGSEMGTKTGLYAVPAEIKDGVPVKAYSFSDMKEHEVYKVKNGKITIKGREYDIKLNDGYYIIRKLTVEECKKLQTVPCWYDFSCVSDSQAYKMLGNGWTVDVIAHLVCATIH